MFSKIILFLLITFFCFSQNETNFWYFGKESGLNFNNGNEILLGNSNMTAPAGCSSISDFNGNLLFYSNGNKVWNKNHQIMINGDDLAGDFDGIQSTIIIPKPNDPSTYYIFYTRKNTVSSPIYFLNGIYYSEIKIDSTNPLGYVTNNKNIRIVSALSTARIAAIHHPNTNAIRVLFVTKSEPSDNVNQNDNLFIRVFNVSSNGINLNSEIHEINFGISEDGAMKISPDSKYIAISDYNNKEIYFYKYNNDLISFEHYLTLPTIPGLGLFLSPYGIEFSQDSKMFYYTGGGFIVQFPLYEIEGNGVASYYLIPVNNPKSLQLARNGKIYVALGDIESPSSLIGVINKPEKLASGCDYSTKSIQFSNAKSTQGLPLFMASSLRDRIIVSDDDCVNTELTFHIDTYRTILSVEWDFDDGTTSNSLNTTHSYIIPGEYKVKVNVVFENNEYTTLYKNIKVYSLPIIDSNQILTQCDTHGNNTTIFNLNNIKDFTNDINSDYSYFFFNSLEDALSNNNQILNSVNYLNISNPEEIFVKIINSNGCEIITSFLLQVNQPENFQIDTLYVCEDSDGVEGDFVGRFNLDTKRLEIINELQFPEDIKINFFVNYSDAQIKENALGKYFNSTSTTLWVRIEDNSYNCLGIFPLSVTVNSSINLEIESQYKLCNTNKELIIDGGQNMSTWVWKNHLGEVLSTQRFFKPTIEGNYSLTVTKNENNLNCSSYKSFSVIKTTDPTFNQITINNNDVYVSVNGNSIYEFSLDGIFYYGSGFSYTFNSVDAGFNTIYVKDVDNCENTIFEEIFFIEIPKFFTPNGDGNNDYWKIKGITRKSFIKANLLIFDRFGKILIELDMLKNHPGWSGEINSQILPASDYWFKINLKDNSGNEVVKKGHFSLLR